MNLYGDHGNILTLVKRCEWRGIKTEVGILNLTTTAGDTRLIGNIVIKNKLFGQIVGYENHSGKTMLEDKSQAFGEVTSGAGNNGEDQTEGCFYKNCIGTYLHGPILPKNPKVADYLILKALERQNPKSAKLVELDDSVEKAAHKSAASRPR